MSSLSTDTGAPARPGTPAARGLPAATVARAASLALMLVAWAVAAHLLADPLRLPGPAAVARFVGHEAARGALWSNLAATLGRVAASFVLAMGIGLALGLVMGRRPRADAWLDNLVIVLLNLPALVTIVLCYVWIGLNETAAITAVALNKIPMVAVMIREGVRALDPQLDDMVRVHAPPRRVVLRDVILPQLAPQIASAGRAGMAMIWKIVLVVEFLGRPDGVGFMIHMGFQMFDVTQILGYALAFVAVMLAVETLVLRPWERHAARWRRA